MSMELDLSRSPERDAEAQAAGLAARLAALAGAAGDRVALAATPGDARRALAAAGVSPAADLTDQGLAAFETDDARAVAAILRAGPASAPVCLVVCPDAETAARVRAALAAPAPVLVEAGIDAIRPAARLAAAAEGRARQAALVDAATLLRRELGVDVEIRAEGLGFPAGAPATLGLRLDGALARIPDAATARRLLAFLGLAGSDRVASVRRTTKETDIAVRVDLDGEGCRADTGVAFFDHMLDQIARHGGLGLDVVCEGDVEVDAHHTIEDVCLALGEALRTALGDKRGIARFGFETPMDETRASVWIDLSGRPFARFDGSIPGERVGGFPVEMCAHAFRSLAETMKAAIHVEVSGENAHHMIESCFKSFGRALRMAKTVEGDRLPSTKGVL